MFRHLTNERQIRTLGLQDDTSLPAAASGAPSHLCHQLEGALKASEVRDIKHGVGIQYADHADSFEIQSFGHHLRSDKHISLSALEILQDSFVGRTCTGRIQIHPGHGGLRKDLMYGIFHLFRTEPSLHQLRTFTGRTASRHVTRVAAIMASHLVQSLMVRQADIAVFALGHPTARVAFYHRSVTSPVLEQYDLFLVFQCPAHLLQQTRRERTGHAPFALQLFDIHHLDFR
ncbi:uncharacterized protein BN471_01053 [Paraprevotella clara CAG:116]|nr:uncharacterized protein BN471_01053 [Paraprevotella clara CAG:116]